MTTQILPSGWTIQHEGQLIRKDLKRRDEWIKALRSGQYQQGCGLLRSPDDKYCCLGVLLQLEGKEFCKYDDGSYFVRTNDSRNRTGSSYVGEEVTTLGFPGVLPITPALINPHGVEVSTGMYELASLNDLGIPFNVIADIIEYCFNQK